ncbi:MAG: class I SAM-dependent methyltransferase, partial [Parasporobacterium sp.]|nr:class I SAM-dependent methyltransferase [Parasporobacterium sp.]
ELVQHNLGRLKAKCPGVKAFKGNAIKLKRFEDDTFDLTLLFGPLYHLISFEDKLRALNEAKRVTKPGGFILVAYIMNEYSVLTYGFKEQHILELIEDERIDDTFRVAPKDGELYDYVRLSDIDELNKKAGLTRVKILSPDGPANYMRPFLNKLTDEEFELFVKYQLSVCERPELLGAGGHILDIVTGK